MNRDSDSSSSNYRVNQNAIVPLLAERGSFVSHRGFFSKPIASSLSILVNYNSKTFASFIHVIRDILSNFLFHTCVIIYKIENHDDKIKIISKLKLFTNLFVKMVNFSNLYILNNIYII